MESKPLVSAIVSTYKSERFIRGKIEDLLNQTLGDRLEIVIINSGSPQNENAIIEEYLKNNSNIKYIHTPERETIYKAWNRGAKAATGKYLCNSNTDDRLRNDAYEVMAGYLETHSEVGLIYADQIISKNENEIFLDVTGGKKIIFPEFDYYKMLDRCIIGSQPMWRASVHYEDNIWFDENYEVCGDHDFELSIAEKHKVVHLKETLGTFYKPDTRTNKEYENIERNLREVTKIRDKHISYFLDAYPSSDTEKFSSKIGRLSAIPFPLYFIMTKLIDVLFWKHLYRPLMFHSVEFIAVFNEVIAKRSSDEKRDAEMRRRYNRFKNFKDFMKSLR